LRVGHNFALSGNFGAVEEDASDDGDGNGSEAGLLLGGRGAELWPAALPPGASDLGAAHARAVGAMLLGAGGGAEASGLAVGGAALPTHDALVPTAKAADYAAWQRRKRDALAAVLGHLGAFGGSTQGPPPRVSAASEAKGAGGGGGGGGGGGRGAAPPTPAMAAAVLVRKAAEALSARPAPRKAWHVLGAAVDIG